MNKINYKSSGVDISEGNRAVELMKSKVKSTYDKNVIGDLGSFSGLYSLKDFMTMKEPVLLSSTDGVGTKLKIAQLMDKHDTVGIDLVAMCVNDLICQGARPLFFLDYIAVGKLQAEKISDIVSGIADGCKLSGMALVGGETAEMPGMYEADEYDLAGFSVGICDKDKIITGSSILEGDVLIGIQSSGIHSNGYSLIRKLFIEKLGWDLNRYVDELGMSIGESLLTPTKIYVKVISDLLNNFDIKGIANITGGGLIENVPRIFPKGLGCIIDKNSWEKPEIFKLIEKLDMIESEDLHRSLNMGVGIVLVVDKAVAEAVLSEITKTEKAYIIGKVTSENEGVVLC